MAGAGEVVVPPGYRFRPTDEELLLYYLVREVDRQPLPVLIPRMEVYCMAPCDLAPDAFDGGDGNLYCFCRRSEKAGGRVKRAVEDAGAWNGNNVRRVLAGGEVISFKASLTFQALPVGEGRGRKASTGWVMDEYRLVGVKESTPPALVLCKMRNKNADGINSGERRGAEVLAQMGALDLPRLEDMAAIPVGYRFDPTDLELLVYYLRREMEGRPLPITIPTLEVYATEPWNLPPGLEGADGHVFCFARRCRLSGKAHRVKRTVGTAGTWFDNKHREIKAGDILVSYETFLSFQVLEAGGRGNKKTNTGWVMHEYRLANDGKGSPEFQDIVLCKIRKRKQLLDGLERGKRKRKPDDEDHHHVVFEVGEGSGTASDQASHGVVQEGCLQPASTTLAPLYPLLPMTVDTGCESVPWSLETLSTWEDEEAMLTLCVSPKDESFAIDAVMLEDQACRTAGEINAGTTCEQGDRAVPEGSTADAGCVVLPSFVRRRCCPLLWEAEEDMLTTLLCGSPRDESFAISAMLPEDQVASAGVQACLFPAVDGNSTEYTTLELQDDQRLGPLDAGRADDDGATLPEFLDKTVVEQAAPPQLLPHGFPPYQPQGEVLIDPAHMSSGVRQIWEHLKICTAGNPMVEAEVEMIPGSELHPAC